MRGQAKTPGVGNTLTIDEHDVWSDFQFLVGFYQYRQFPVGKKTRDIWHGRAQARIAVTEQRKSWKGKQANARAKVLAV
jgi:hypothetical protein